MKKLLKVVGIGALVAVLGMIAIGTVAYADEDSDAGFDFRGRVQTAIANILGITVDEYESAIDQAQTQVLDEAVAEGWLTEEQAEMMEQRMEQGPPDGMMGKGHRGGGLMGGPQDMMGTVGEVLGLETTDLMDALREGTSIADLAAENGVETQTIVNAVLNQVAEQIAEAIGEGKITELQGEQMLSQAEERITSMLENGEMVRMPGGFGGRGRPPGGFPDDGEGTPGESGGMRGRFPNIQSGESL